jgi:phosphatidylinositol glycan class C protein
MIKNAHVIPYDYWNVLRDATVLAQQVSTVTVFAILFVYTMWDELPVAFLCAVDAALFLVGYVVWTLIGDDRARTRPLVEAVLLVMLLIGVSPVIRSLTLSYSNDTIWAWSLTLFATHIITQDYSFLSGRSEQPSSSAALSLNAAVFATVLLVSRLESSAHAFAILCLAFELFGLSPIVRRDLKASSPDMHIALTVLLYVMAASLLFPLSTPIAITYLVGLPFIVFGSPAWLILIQKYKSEIIGPWDEAVPSNVSL